MELFETIHDAAAVRRFRPDPVPDQLITRLLDAAIRAPSASNTQNWAFVVVRDREQRRQLADLYRRAFELISAMYRDRQPAPHQSAASYRKMMDSAEYLAEHLHEVPLMIVAGLITPASSRRPPAEHAERVSAAAARISGASIYPAVQNILLACRAMGLGTVLTTIHAYYDEEVKAALGLPPEFMSYAMLPVGYPAEAFKTRPLKRRPLNEVACLDRWGNDWRG